MKFKLILILFCLLWSFSGYWSTNGFCQSLASGKKLDFSNPISSGKDYDISFPGNKNSIISPLKQKSEIKAGLFSLVFPGAGQIYNGSWKRSIVFLGVEAVSWYVYFDSKKKGKDIEEEYEAYANHHWNEEAYRAEHQSYPGLPDTHTLPETHTQQYYEMIGKYNQFAPWWDDYDGTNSTNRLYYMDVRYDSNKQFDKSQKMEMLLLAARVVSMIDAFFTVKLHNRKIPEVSVKIEKFNNSEYVPVVNLSTKW